MNRKILLIVFFSLNLSLTVQAEKPGGSLYLEGSESAALILCHGRAKSPDWKVVDPLRRAVNKKMNWHTLSLQMPADDKYWENYAEDFPAAYRTIESAIRFLKDEKKINHIFLMGHSMGARMASAFMAETHSQSITGLVIAGCRNNGSYPLDCKTSISKVTIPVLDIWGGSNEKDISAAEDRAELVNEKYRQVSIEGANHKFDGRETDFTTAVIHWLQQH